MVNNNDWARAIDSLEEELAACAVQVLECIELQNTGQ